MKDLNVTTNRQQVAVLWRGNPALGSSDVQRDIRYPAIVDALTQEGMAVRLLVYLDAEVDRARDVLDNSRAVLVWADPISADGNRSMLDEILRDAAGAGTRIYTHPDVILKMGTKDVLYDTRELTWSQDVRRYATHHVFKDQFPAVLAAGQPRVLKQHRGNGGIGVWKVEVVGNDGIGRDPGGAIVRIQHAAPRDGTFEEMSLRDFFEMMQPYFDGTGHLIDQAFATRVREGMVRAYIVKNQVVGFARQYADRGDQGCEPVPAVRVFGVPAAKTMLDVDQPEFVNLRRRLEREWIPGLQRLVGVSDAELPLLWDTDFLFGPKDNLGSDTYLLCEINVSCVSPFPGAAPTALAQELARELA